MTTNQSFIAAYLKLVLADPPDQCLVLQVVDGPAPEHLVGEAGGHPAARWRDPAARWRYTAARWRYTSTHLPALRRQAHPH